MLLTFLLIIIIAISLPYFSLDRLNSRTFWRRISTASIVIALIIFIESITLNMENTIALYNGLFNHTLQNSIFIGLTLISSLILSSIGSSPIKTFNESILLQKNDLQIQFKSFNSSILSLDSRDRERLVFVFSLIIGSIILIGASDFLTIFLGLELQSYSAYILAASYRNYEPSEAAGLKYFLLGALSSALIFMGLALLYVYSGNSNFDLSFLVLSAINSSDYIFTIDTMVPYLGAILILIGFSWKIAAAPLQAWSIDVYDAVPSRTTAILSLIPKIGLISFLSKMIYDVTSLINFSNLLEKGFNLTIIDINYIIYIIIGLSLIIGSIYGIYQPRIKRLLAYSSVLNIGFVLMGALLINLGNYDSFINSFYIIQYVVTTATIWLSLTSLEKFTGIEVTLNSQLQGIGNSTLTRLNKLSNYVKVENVFIAVSLTILILSTAGIPPMIGFFAKYEVILLALKTEYFTLAILAILASLFSTYYYLNIVKNIWFKTTKVSLNSTLSVKEVSLDAKPLISSASQENKENTNLNNLSLIKSNFESLNSTPVNLDEFVGSSSFIVLFTSGISMFVLQYSVIYIFLTLTF